MFQRLSVAISAAGGPFAVALYFATIVVIGAWSFIGSVGWWLALSDPWTRAAAISLHLGAVVYAACAIKLAAPKLARLNTMRHGALLALIGAICVLVTGYGGKQGLALIEQRTWTHYDAYQVTLPALEAAEARLATILEDIKTLPPVPLTYPNGGIIGVNTRDRLNAERNRTFEHLREAEGEAREAVNAATTAPVAPPGQRMSEATRWGFMLVAEIIEVLGFWAIGMAVGHMRHTAPMGRDIVGQARPTKRGTPKRAPRISQASSDEGGAQIVPLITFSTLPSPKKRASHGTARRGTRDAMALEDLAQDQRRALALKAANPKMSFRAIEQATGVPKSTVQRYWKWARHHGDR